MALSQELEVDGGPSHIHARKYSVLFRRADGRAKWESLG
jgi:hypothetical protein